MSPETVLIGSFFVRRFNHLACPFQGEIRLKPVLSELVLITARENSFTTLKQDV